MSEILQDVQALIFDLDGTLYSLRGFTRRLVLPSIFKLRYLVALRKARKKMMGVNTGDGETFYRRFFEVFTEVSSLEKEAVRSWYFSSFYPAFIRILGRKDMARPGVNSLLLALREHGIRTALVSDYAMISERLRALGINESLLDTVVSSEEIGALKPDPSGFLRAAERLDVRPAEVLVCGDRLDTDGEGAARAGMKFVKICDKQEDGTRRYTWQAFYDKLTAEIN